MNGQCQEIHRTWLAFPHTCESSTQSPGSVPAGSRLPPTASRRAPVLHGLQPVRAASGAPGEAAGVRARVSGFGCTADFTGTIHGCFDNADGTLVADRTSRDLVASNANCPGLISNGDTAALKAVIELSPASKITQD